MTARFGISFVALSAAASIALGLAGTSTSRAGTSATGVAADWIAYSEGKSPISVPHLRLFNVDTGASRALAPSRFAHDPSWSPDGKRLVVEDYGRNPGNGAQLALLRFPGGSLQRITRSAALDENPVWSPNGSRIAFSRSPLSGADVGIWVMRAGGGGERQLTRNQFGDYGAAWSPNSMRIAFTRYRSSAGARDLWVMRADGRGQRLVVPSATGAAWSPDGSRLALGKLTGRTIPSCGCAVTDLYLGDANGAHRQLLVRNGGAPAWSPDGERIAFVRWEGGRTHLWLVNADGSGLRRLTGGAQSQRAPAWRPAGG